MKKPIYKKWWLWVIVVVVAAVIFSPGSDNNGVDATGNIGSTNNVSSSNSTVAPASASVEKKPDLELIDHETTSDGSFSYIVGTVKNNTKKTYSYVQVEINLYDESGAQIGSTFDNVNNLEPDGTWKFKAIVMEDDVASYKIKDITGY